MEKTADYIIKTIAPIFNRQGYVGTSLSDLTKATNLTKGALYCNFKNKEELAIASFKLNVKSVIFPLNQKIQQAETSIDKLYAITDYYRNYYNSIINIGGCPILNVNIDTKNNNERLHQLSKQVAQRLVDDLERIVFEGIENNEISKMINPDIEAKNIYSMIEGSVFMAFTHENPAYLTGMMDHIDRFIEEKIKN